MPEWIQRDFRAAQNADMVERVTLGRPDDTYSLDASAGIGTAITMKVRPSATHATVLINISLALGYIAIIDAPKRVISIVVTAALLSAVPPGEYVYDMVANGSDGFIHRAMAGKFIIEAAVTR